jgi:D-alanine-D-alanine ligase
VQTDDIQRQAVESPEAFGRVAVLLGGASAEREISLMSGAAVCDALRRRGVRADQVDPAGGQLASLIDSYDRAWIALHGRGGEDGSLQGLLEQLGIPYTGSGVLGCALSMDKLRSKRLLVGAGLATPAYHVLRGPQDFDAAIAALGLPMMIKPAAEGSSIGLTRVGQSDELPAAWETAAACRCEVFAEGWVTGAEYTAGVLQGQVLPLVRIDVDDGFYDYQAKYFSDDTRYVCPCGLDDTAIRTYSELCGKAFDAVGGRGWGRVDFMLDEQGNALILEVNMVPGMTSHSLVPMAAAEAGIDFDELCWRILETSFGSLD